MPHAAASGRQVSSSTPRRPMARLDSIQGITAKQIERLGEAGVKST
jgi:hypothetical protein